MGAIFYLLDKCKSRPSYQEDVPQKILLQCNCQKNTVGVIAPTALPQGYNVLTIDCLPLRKPTSVRPANSLAHCSKHIQSEFFVVPFEYIWNLKELLIFTK